MKWERLLIVITPLIVQSVSLCITTTIIIIIIIIETAAVCITWVTIVDRHQTKRHLHKLRVLRPFCSLRKDQSRHRLSA